MERQDEMKRGDAMLGQLSGLVRERAEEVANKHLKRKLVVFIRGKKYNVPAYLTTDIRTYLSQESDENSAENSLEALRSLLRRKTK